jgi:hypothetical protein
MSWASHLMAPAPSFTKEIHAASMQHRSYRHRWRPTNRLVPQPNQGRDTLGNENAGKAAEYMRYAERCVETAKTLLDREDRSLFREMAAEWLRLAPLIAENVAHSARSSPKRRKTSQG